MKSCNSFKPSHLTTFLIYMTPNMAKWSTIPALYSRNPRFKFWPRDYHKVFQDFPQSLQRNPGTVPYARL